MADESPSKAPEEPSAQFRRAFREVVGNPDFPAYFADVQRKSHGEDAEGRKCYWCFQIATAADLPVRHRLLEVEVVDGRARADKNEDPVTPDGRSHPWNAAEDRILCEDCIGDVPHSELIPEAVRGTGSGYRRYLRNTPLENRAIVAEVGRPDLTPEEFLISGRYSVGDRTAENIRGFVEVLLPVARMIADIQTQLGVEGEHTSDTVLDDLEFVTTWFAAFDLGKQTYGDRFAIITVVLRDADGGLELACTPRQFGATSDLIEPTLRSRHGDRLVGIIASQMSPK